MACVQDADGLIHLEQVLPHRLVAAGVQFLVQQRRAFGASLLGIAELQIALCAGDQLLAQKVGLFSSVFTAARFGLFCEKDRRA